MKKALLIALALGLICAWAAPAMAIDWMVIGAFTVKEDVYKNVDLRCPVYMGGIPGSFRITGSTPVFPGFTSSPILLLGTPSTNDPAWNRVSQFTQMRGDIYVIAKASEDLKGVFGIEVNSTRFGDSDGTYIPYYPGSPGLGSGNAGRWNADAIAIQVKSMYIDFKVPMIPMWFKVGIQPFQLRNAVFLYADAAGIWGTLKLDLDPVLLKISPFWAKIYGEPALAQTTITGLPSQNSVPTDWTTADDANFFGVDINATIGGFKPGVFFAMQRMAHLYQLPAGIPDPLSLFPGAVTPGGDGWSNMWWIGTYLDATVGPVSFTGDFVYNGGFEGNKSGWNLYNNPMSPFTGGNYVGDFAHYGRIHEAFETRGVASYKMNKFTFGIGALYGTGDNPTTPFKDEGYHVPYNSEAAFFNDDFVVLTGDWGLREPFGTQNVGGLFKAWSDVGQGVWYVRGFADYQVLDWLKLKANAGYIGNTVSHGSEFSTDSFYLVSPITAQPVTPIFDNGNSDTIGVELDAGVQINIYKNLFWDSAFGYIIGGKALLSQYGGYRAQDPWMFTSVLTYQF